MGLIEMIIKDAKVAEAQATRSEMDANRAYEAFVKETNLSVASRNKQIVSESKDKAKKEAELVGAGKDKESNKVQAEQLEKTKAELHQTCDFLLKNFEIRQTALTEEVGALREAVSILSGAKL